MEDAQPSLTSATLRLAGDDIYAEIAQRFGAHRVQFNDLDDPRAARVLLHNELDKHTPLLPVQAAGADLAYRLAVVDAAFRPHPAVERRNASRVREELVELIRPALRNPDDVDAARIVANTIQEAHESGTRQHLPAMIAPLVRPSALMFLGLECEVRGESAVVNGDQVTAMALYDELETTLPLESLAGVSDPLNWPECNECFRSVEPIPGTFWSTSAGYGIDVVEDFKIALTDFHATTALSITYASVPLQTVMQYDLSRDHANMGDGHVDVDRGYARALDLGGTRRFQALKVVHFDDDALASVVSWFSCLWWDLMTVRTALLCPNRKVTTKDELKKRVGGPEPSGAMRSIVTPTEEQAATDDIGPLETLVRDWSGVMLGATREWLGIATRTKRRWTPGEPVTDGKLTSDLIEAFEHLTPVIGRAIDVGIKSTQVVGDHVAGYVPAKPNPAGGDTAKRTTATVTKKTTKSTKATKTAKATKPSKPDQPDKGRVR